MINHAKAIELRNMGKYTCVTLGSNERIKSDIWE
jgi:hypothetical protein